MTGKYNIKDLEVLSGIKAHTLRIWEQRYGILQPERTDTNIRLYSNEDLKRILNVSTLNKSGIKISKIAQLKEAEINDAVKKLIVTGDDKDGLIDGLIVAMVDLNEEMFNRIISINTVKEGFEKTIIEVIFPFLKKTGVMWLTDSINPAQEHFITNLIRQKLIAAIDSVNGHHTETSPKITFYLPEAELHEISLLLYNYMAKTRGYNTIYLGQSVPFNDLIKVQSISHTEIMVTVITQSLKEIEFEEYVNKLAHSLPNTKIFISGYQAIKNPIKSPKNVRIFESPADFIQLL
ncbi:MAG: MerR family transcriptional regulator [Bacteroidia bacterium]|nr:MerR family transcriptional regulator [Bacteroidia bacterium]